MAEKTVSMIPVLPPLPQVKRVAVYCRVSSRIEEQIRSVGAQASYLVNMVVRHTGWSFQGLYIDICSGSSAENRPELQRMISQARQKLIDVVLVRTVSRLGRNTLDTLTIARELKQISVEMIFVDDNISTMDPDGEFLLSLMASFAQADNESRSLNMKWGIQKQVHDGSSVLFKKKCYGYKNDDEGNMVISEQEAQVVRWIYKSYLSGNSKTTIQRQLEEAGIPSPTGREKWCLKSIMDILENEKYYGAVCVYKSFISDSLSHRRVKNDGRHEFIWYFDHHEPIISKQEFMEVMEEKKKRSNFETDENGNRVRRNTRFCSANVTISLPGKDDGCMPAP